MAGTDRDRTTEPPEPPETPEDHETPRRRLERMVGEKVRRAVEKGIEAGFETLSRTDGALRGVAEGSRLPREVVNYVFAQIDETKSTTVRVMAREFRDFLDKTDLAVVLRNALTSLSFEIRTEIRFVPNERGTGVRPSVKSRAKPRRSGTAQAPDEDAPPSDVPPAPAED